MMSNPTAVFSRFTKGNSLRGMIVLLLSLVSLQLATAQSAGPRSSFAAVDDTTVRSGANARKNFGREPLLEVRNDRGGASETYIKFDLTGADPALTHARLRLFMTLEKAEPVAVLIGAASDNNWLETIITWNDKPAYLKTVATVPLNGAQGAWRELDITSFVKSELARKNENITLVITLPEDSNNKVTIASREADANQPEIVVARKVFRTRIAFQPASKALPPTYVADTGAPFGSRQNGMRYGWSTDVSKYVRDREDAKQQDGKPARAPDTRYNGVAFMDHANMASPAFWEIEIPNGKYRVHLVAGDPCAFDSVFAITVEDVLLVDGVPDEKKRWAENSKVIEVKDGRLTVNNHTKGINNKLCFIEIVESNEP